MKSRITTTKPTRATISPQIREILKQSSRDDLIITPALNEFLVTWDEVVPPHVARRVAEVMATPPRKRSGSWSASGAGDCMRRQELQFLGMPSNGRADPRLQMIFLNGTFTHIRYQTLLMTAGILDNIEVLVKKPSQRARCSMDGVGVGQRGRYSDRDFGFELKSRNDYAFKSQVIKSVDEKTRKQVDFEFLLSGFDLFVIMNENKNNQEPKEWVFLRDEGRVREMARQVRDLNKAIDIQYLHPLLPECKKQLKSGEFYKCPYGGQGGACVLAGNWPRKVGV